MRRKDREVTDFKEIIEIMKNCDVCRLALNDADGYPYIVPLNFGLKVQDDEIVLIFHSALEGHKLDLIKKDSRAAFEMDTKHKLVYEDAKGMCTMGYESVIGKGEVVIFDEAEKLQALKDLMEQYYPGENKGFNLAAVEKTAVYGLRVASITAKRNVK